MSLLSREPDGGTAQSVPSSNLRDRILSQVQKTPSPVRSEVTRRTRVLVAVACALSLATFLALGGIRLAHRPVGFVAIVAVGWGIGTAILTWMAFARGPSSLGLTRRVLLAGAVVVAPALFAWTCMWASAWPEMHSFDSSWGNYLDCFMYTILLGLAPLVPLVLARRNSDPVHPRATGAVLGAAMGAWAGTLIDLRCACVNICHMAFAHTLPTIVLAVLAAIVAPRILGF